MRSLIFLSAVIFLSSCFWKKKVIEPDLSIKVDGWKAVYSADTAVKKIKFFSTPRPVIRAGKIYAAGNFIFQNDIGTGIHFIDNAAPASAHRTAFLEIPGNTDFSFKGNYLYANNYTDLLVIDMANVSAPIEIKRFINSFGMYNSGSPYPWQAPTESGYYECPEVKPGMIITSWEKGKVPQYCYKSN